MNREEVIGKVKILKDELKINGIIIIGITGSVARGDDNIDSDIDIVYQIDDPKSFILKNGGFSSFTKINDTKSYIEKALDKKVDMIALSGLNRVSQEYIIRDLIHV